MINETLPLIGQGTWMLERDPREQAVAALRGGVGLGMRLIDTAEMYGSGKVEEVVGEALGGLRREDVFLVSKVLPSNASYDGTRRACHRSLRRLGVKRLDLYLLHWRGSYALKDTMRGLESLVDEGLTRYIGVSNFDVDDVEEARGALRNHPLACNQVLYHLGDRGIERRLIPHCRQHGIAVMGYSPFGHSGFRGHATLEAIGRRIGKTPRQIVLNFLIRDGVFAIPKAGNLPHVRENSGAAGWKLDEADVALVDQTWPAPQTDVPLGMI